MNTNTTFSPAAFLYLNPELWSCQHGHGARELEPENARRLFEQHNTLERPLHHTFAGCPPPDSDFDPEIFVVSARDALDIASLNQHIRRASGGGAEGAFLPTISQAVHPVYRPGAAGDEVSFAFEDYLCDLTERVLVAGDVVRIDMQVDGRFATSYECDVTSIDREQRTFACRNHSLATVAHTASRCSFVLYGQKLYDVRRLALINYARGARLFDGALDGGAGDGDQRLDASFNPALYRLLYPDARTLSDVEAYMDYRSRSAQGASRVSGASDIERVIFDVVSISAPSATLTDPLRWTSNMARDAVDRTRWTSNAVASLADEARRTYAKESCVTGKLDWTSNAVEHLARAAVLKTPGGGDGVTVAGDLEVRQRVTIASDADVALEVRGGVRAADYLVASDRRIKRDVLPLDPDRCVDMVRRMRVCNYALIAGGEEDAHHHHEDRLGFIAQELEAIDPRLTRTTAEFVPNIMRELYVDKLGRVKLGGDDATGNMGEGDVIKVLVRSPSDLRSPSDRGEQKYDAVHVTVRAKKPDCFLVDNPDGRVYDGTHLFYGTRVEDFKCVNYSHLLAVLVGAIQRLLPPTG